MTRNDIQMQAHNQGVRLVELAKNFNYSTSSFIARNIDNELKLLNDIWNGLNTLNENYKLSTKENTDGKR